MLNTTGSECHFTLTYQLKYREIEQNLAMWRRACGPCSYHTPCSIQLNCVSQLMGMCSCLIQLGRRYTTIELMQKEICPNTISVRKSKKACLTAKFLQLTRCCSLIMLPWYLFLTFVSSFFIRLLGDTTYLHMLGTQLWLPYLLTFINLCSFWNAKTIRLPTTRLCWSAWICPVGRVIMVDFTFWSSTCSYRWGWYVTGK